MQPRENIHERARGRWRGILPELGLDAKHLTGKHGPCPMCGGTDRFRWTDQGGGGGYICGQCGAGSGIDLVMKVNRIGFVDAVKLIEPKLGDAPVVIPPTRADTSKFGDAIWAEAKPLTGMDPASKYLRQRGIRVAEGPQMIRYTMSTSYRGKDGSRSRHCAMVARFASPDVTRFTTHLTYLAETGAKADVDEVKKLAPGKVPDGGAVRLAPAAATMGIAEGIETALSAAQLDGVPVWAALNSGLLTKWEPPRQAKCVIVYADHDANFTGQAAAYALAHRLAAVNKLQVEVRIPDSMGDDWNDVLKAA